MKKTISVFDGYKFSESAKEYSIYIAKHNNVHLVGVFLDDVLYHSYRFSDIQFTGEGNLNQLNKEDQEKRDLAVHLFETAIQAAKLNYSIRRPKERAFTELLHESVYSDLLIIYKNETFTPFEESSPTRFIRELLGEAQCPLLLVPFTFRPIEKILLLYNGKPSSVHAIKMFSYILPSFKHLPVEVLTVKSERTSLHLPDKKLLKEFMHRHFPEATYNVLHGEAEEEIISYLKLQKENVLVVLGSSQRNMVSRLIKKGMIDSLLQEVEFPLFAVQND